MIFKKRLKEMNQCIKNIRLIKSYSIEDVKLSRLKKIKEKEINTRRRATLFLFGRWALSGLAVFLIKAFVTMFYSYYYPLSATVCFSIHRQVDRISQPFTNLAKCLDDYYMSKRWITAIREFLNLPEVDGYSKNDKNENVMDVEEEQNVVDYNDCSFSWNFRNKDKVQDESESTENRKNQSEDIVLKNLNVSIKQGEHIGIFGSVGSGKTSFLLSIIGEMVNIEGHRKIRLRNLRNVSLDQKEQKKEESCICFLPQTNWILSRSLRENIILGQPYNEEKFRKCVKCCALEEDLETLSNGEMTIIDEYCLSGGQKLRVSLARLLYHKDLSNLFLFDDPFQQLDPKVATHIYEHVFLDLLKNKTVLLVTHHTQFTRHMHRILMMQDGRITKDGKFSDFHTNADTQKPQQKQKEKKNDFFDSKSPNKSKNVIVSDLENEDVRRKYRDGIDISLIWRFLCRSKIIIFNFCFCIIYTFLKKYRRQFLNGWIKNDPSHEIHPLSYYTTWYVVIGVTQMFLYYFTRYVYEYYFFDLSQSVHSSLLAKVFHARMSFFDGRSIGSIVSRFTRDLNVLEQSLMQRVRVTIDILVLHSFTYLLIFVETPWYFAIFLPLCVVVWRIGTVYLRGFMVLCRITEEQPSRVHDFISETMDGISSIRSMNLQPYFVRKFRDEVKLKNQYMIRRIYMNQWMSRTISLFKHICNHLFILLCVFMRVPASSFIVTYQNITSINHHFTYFIKLIPNLRRDVLTLERLEEFEDIEIEDTRGINPQKTVFPRGKIEFDDVSFRYDISSPVNVLKNISFSLEAGERLGIVGRTGDGKSTMAKLLFRFYGLEEGSGAILMDDIPISKIALDCVRKNIAYIPQNPVLLGDTIRAILDPRNLHSDEQILVVLRRVYLQELVNKVEKKVDENVVSPWDVDIGSIKVSAGEKQLMCFARALLNKKRVLVLDEHSNSTDFETDEKIRKLLDSEFAESFVLCIAHRMETVLGFDKVAVLKKGRLVQFGKPKVLLQEEESLLKQMVDNLGDERAKKLTKEVLEKEL